MSAQSLEEVEHGENGESAFAEVAIPRKKTYKAFNRFTRITYGDTSLRLADEGAMSWPKHDPRRAAGDEVRTFLFTLTAMPTSSFGLHF